MTDEILENLRQAETLVAEMLKQSSSPAQVQKTLGTIRETIKILESRRQGNARATHE